MSSRRAIKFCFGITLSMTVFLSNFIAELNADTLYLKNGRSIEGIIKSENGDVIELEVCSGTVKFKKSEIKSIERDSVEASSAIRQKWERQKLEAQKKILQQSLEEELKPRKIEFSAQRQNIVLYVTLNRKIEAPLVLDTGASVVILRKGIAKKLGIDLDKVEPDAKLTLADGRQADAKHIVLESVKVEGVEARDVDAVIMLDEDGDADFGDGLLGMSFLNRFNFKVDHKNKKLILERL